MRRQKVHALGASTRLWCQAPHIGAAEDWRVAPEIDKM